MLNDDCSSSSRRLTWASARASAQLLRGGVRFLLSGFNDSDAAVRVEAEGALKQLLLLLLGVGLVRLLKLRCLKASELSELRDVVPPGAAVRSFRTTRRGLWVSKDLLTSATCKQIVWIEHYQHCNAT